MTVIVRKTGLSIFLLRNISYSTKLFSHCQRLLRPAGKKPKTHPFSWKIKIERPRTLRVHKIVTSICPNGFIIQTNNNMAVKVNPLFDNEPQQLSLTLRTKSKRRFRISLRRVRNLCMPTASRIERNGTTAEDLTMLKNLVASVLQNEGLQPSTTTIRN